MRTPSISGRVVQQALLIVGAIAASAFSVLAQERASIPEPAKAVTTPLIRAVPVQANAPGAQAATEPQGAAGKQAEPLAKEPGKPIPHIALLLPLASKTYGKVADALKLGFIAGAEADGKNAPPYRIYSAEDEGTSLAVQYRKAVAEGASAIIGGVTREGANTVARESRFLPTLGLNAPITSADNDLPDRFFYISLSLDLEAKLVARMAFGEGLRDIAMLVNNNPLAKRVQDSFEQEWLRMGGSVTARISFGNDPNDATRVAATMEKINERAGNKTDAVFLAADPAAARFIRPYLPSGMPVFATSHTVDPRAEAVANLDLENVRFLEMPWFAEPDHPAVMAYAKPQQSLAVEYERLYALGIDAWRLGQLIARTDNARAPLDGVTGRITLDGRQFTRALSSVEVRDGKALLYRPIQ
jgi:outer membrane PBP1 activator LpoA protein